MGAAPNSSPRFSVAEVYDHREISRGPFGAQKEPPLSKNHVFATAAFRAGIFLAFGTFSANSKPTLPFSNFRISPYHYRDRSDASGSISQGNALQLKPKSDFVRRRIAATP